MFRVIIAGSRSFSDYPLLEKTMDALLRNTSDEITVLCGQASGADTLGDYYARRRGYEVEYYPADWKENGKQAGYIRNVRMAENADALAAFWDGKSRGTKHMIETAQKYGLKVRVKKF